MSESLIISILTVITSAVASMSLVNWRLTQIEKRLDNHNGYAQKFAETTSDIAVIKTDIDYIKTQLNHLNKS